MLLNSEYLSEKGVRMELSIDVYVGQRVRQRRWMLGMTQKQLGDKIGMRLQQIRRFEAATNRLSARGMWDIAVALEVPVAYFFEGLAGQPPNTGEVRDDLPADTEALELIRTYYGIPISQRRRLFDLARVLSAAA